MFEEIDINEGTKDAIEIRYDNDMNLQEQMADAIQELTQDKFEQLSRRIELLDNNTSFRMSKNGAKYPPDCHSFIALNAPDKKGWPSQKRWFFAFGIFVFLVQMCFHVLLIWRVVDKTNGTTVENDNPDQDQDKN